MNNKYYKDLISVSAQMVMQLQVLHGHAVTGAAWFNFFSSARVAVADI